MSGTSYRITVTTATPRVVVGVRGDLSPRLTVGVRAVTPQPPPSISAEADADFMSGQPAIIRDNTHADLASAMGAGSAQVAGLILAATALGKSAVLQTEGLFTLSDWSAVVGNNTLTAGALYFLGTIPGTLTSVPPTNSGQYVVTVGRAVSPVTLDLTIQPSIRL